jgi:hydrogenase maturation protease
MEMTNPKKLLEPEFATSLRDLLNERVCIVGVGNRQRGDDGAGPKLIDARHPTARGAWLDAGVVPENLLEPILRTNPDTVLIVDAVAFGGIPGECRLMDAASLDTVSVSTHAGSLSMLNDYLSARTDARIQLIAIQPERIDVREELSPPVEKSVRELAALLSDALAPAKL